jgi:hypothetical protein
MYPAQGDTPDTEPTEPPAGNKEHVA